MVLLCNNIGISNEYNSKDIQCYFMIFSAPNPPTTVTCGVCGAVRFYRFVKQARKFGIYSCESCRKFISKMLKKEKMSQRTGPVVMQCLKGEGMCFFTNVFVYILIHVLFLYKNWKFFDNLPYLQNVFIIILPRNRFLFK